MTSSVFSAVTFVTALGSALVAGIFFALSTFVMAALGRLPTEQGIAAMQSINLTVINPWFFTAFFGTALGCAVPAVYAVFNWSAPGSGYLVGGCTLYLLGSIAVTIAFNVPLNNALAAVDPGSHDGATFWSRYLQTWVFWNHVRTAAPLAAAAAFMMALR